MGKMELVWENILNEPFADGAQDIAQKKTVPTTRAGTTSKFTDMGG